MLTQIVCILKTVVWNDTQNNFFLHTWGYHRKNINIFERKFYRRILGPDYENFKQNWRLLTNKEIYVMVKKTVHNRDNKVK